MMKKNFALILTLCLTLTCSFMFVACTDTTTTPEEALEKYIQEIKTGTQQSGEREITNYQCVVSDSVDWTSMNDEKRKEITDAAVLECRKTAEANGINDYNVLGLQNNTMLFMYDRAYEQVIVYVDGTATDTTIPAP